MLSPTSGAAVSAIRYHFVHDTVTLYPYFVLEPLGRLDDPLLRLTRSWPNDRHELSLRCLCGCLSPASG